MQVNPFVAHYPKVDALLNIPTFFDVVKKEYPTFSSQGIFHSESQPAFFVYQYVSSEIVHTGVMASIHVQDYIDGKVKKHEKTLEAKENKQKILLESRDACIKPVLLTYQNVSEIDQFLSNIIASRLPDKVTPIGEGEHRFWLVTNPTKVTFLQNAFEGVDSVYIADGHHRCACVAKSYTTGLETYNRFVGVLMAADEVNVFAFHRIIKNINTEIFPVFLDKISSLCHITVSQEQVQPKHKHQMVLYYQKQWYVLEWKESVLAKYASKEVLLDTYLLNEEVLINLLGITDIRSSKDIVYMSARDPIQELRDTVDTASNGLAVLLHPMQVEDMMAAVDGGDTLPPKSTFFEPRLKNGLIVMKYDNE